MWKKWVSVVLCLVLALCSGFHQIAKNLTITAAAATAEENLTAFFDSMYDATRTSIYNGTSFRMNGRTYTQGIVFDQCGSISGHSAVASFNVADINTISFTMGHIDNSDDASAELAIYLDNIIYDKISLWRSKPLEEYSLDVSDSTKLTFEIVLSNYSNSNYALANVTLDNQGTATYQVPQYATAKEFINDYYDAYGFEMYDATSPKVYSFNMSGKTYYQGLLFKVEWHGLSVGGAQSAVSFNVENVDTISFTFGHIDDSSIANAVLSIYLDDVIFTTLERSASDLPNEYVLDVSENANIRFVLTVDNFSDSHYALANVALDGDYSSFTDGSYSNSSKIIDLNDFTGDIDGDGVINANDAYFCLLAYAKISVGQDSGLTAAQIQAADVDDDGSITANDAYYILLYYAKKSVGQDVSWAELLG
ncbi:MAG: dockerin type I domain-containing protein [Ruminococcus sp.]